MSAVITPFEGTELFNTASFNNRISQINTGFSYVSNPNLLDNWYFGNPVDQRGGYVVPPGMAYKDVNTGVTVGTTTTYYTVTQFSNGNAIITVDGLNRFVQPGGFVRGYTGNGYTVDRWGILNNVTATLQNASLNIAYTESGWNLYTFLDNVLIPGTTYTLSCLYKASGNPIRLVCTWGTNKFFYNEQAPISDDWTLAEITGTIPADATIDTNEIVVQSLGSGAGNFSLKAIKLELGPTQTLAHKENGQWVLNEVPDYGEQLRRCQRYHYQVHYDQYETIGFAYDGPEYAFIILPLPTEMRGTTPTLKIIGDISIGGKVRTLTGCNCHGCEAVIGVNYTAQPSSAGATYAYSTSAGGVTISIIYDL